MPSDTLGKGPPVEGVLLAQGVSRRYRQKKGGDLLAVNRVDLVLRPGECLGIVGESGCGKSTLARMLTGVEKPTEGSVLFGGKDIFARLKQDRLAFRRECQMVFQNPFELFDPLYTVGSILTSALKVHLIGQNRREREQHCLRVLEQMGVTPAADFLGRRPGQLSGGQLQRIAIARSMLLSPRCLVADEAVSMLDVSVRAEIVNLLIELVKERQASLLFISHDIAITRYVSNRIFVMYQGEFVEGGPAEQLIDDPAHPYTQMLIDSCKGTGFSGKMAPEIHRPMEGCLFAPRCPEVGKQCREEKPPLIPGGPERLLRCWRRTGCEKR